jgi:hypothetical protein
MSDQKPLFKSASPPIPDEVDLQKQLAELDAEIERTRLAIELPHLYGWKWYKWAADFRDSTNQVNLLCAANQISKSSTQIRKCILWATDQQLWPSLWAQKPIQFWYLYPGQKQVNAEFETKWKQFLPKGAMKDDPYYGWSVEKNKGDIVAIHFNSGVHLYFKTYSQNAEALQTGTCDAIFCDEELPIEHFDELMLRISASSGYFHMVFTATKGQDEWRRAMEPTQQEVDDGKEFLADAFKQTVSLYDAMYYEDGLPSHWTLEKIKKIEARCSTQLEVLKRVHGKFILIGGRKYESFDITRHMKKKHPIPKEWLIYVGADPGGGDKGKAATSNRAKKRIASKASLVFVAVRPDFRAGRVFLGWRGDNSTTTAGDVVEKYIKMKDDNKLHPTGKYYDWASKDFNTIATRMGHSFEQADKNHERGEDIINTLFKNDMMFIYEDEELIKLGAELATIPKGVNKRDIQDDFSDAFRYAITKIPWDWTVITGEPLKLDEDPEKQMNSTQREIFERRKAFDDANREEQERIDQEIGEWNDLYGS